MKQGSLETPSENGVAKSSEARFETRKVDTGPLGDNYTTRTLAVIETGGGRAETPLPRLPEPFVVAPSGGLRFAGVETAPITARRKLYFSEVVSDPSNPASPTNFFITVDGATPKLFSPDNPPAITTRTPPAY